MGSVEMTTNPTRPAPLRGKAYYAELKRIRDEITAPLTVDFNILKTQHGKITPVLVGWLALKYDVNLKAMFDILNDLKLIPCCLYDKIITYGGVKVGTIFDEARKV